MPRRSRNSSSKRASIHLEGPLQIASQHVSANRHELHKLKTLVEKIIEKLIANMKNQSALFRKLYIRRFGGGSSYENLQIRNHQEFDIDLLLKMPEDQHEIILSSNKPGYVHARFHTIPEEFRDLVDDNNYLLASKMKSFLQSIFDKVTQDGVISIGKKRYQLEKVQNTRVCLTLTVDVGLENPVFIDLVPCFLMGAKEWPSGGFRSKPLHTPESFFIVPKSPKFDHPHVDTYWRLSFQMQEKKMMFNMLWMKPTIRILKAVRDYFQHNVSSYALKTMFFWELYDETAFLTSSDLWKGPLSYCVVHMLQKYLFYLEEGGIPYFWNKKCNLIEDLGDYELLQYKTHLEGLIQDIRNKRSDKIICCIDNKIEK